ncbi:GNAT family N-acetyltransferase (plasmid) [Cytobacillus spongiae]|uniref:GNAT family N-acetyltransferase n=1 Tax=Cytobacillus spongiae TaxID=2901381 RepID=UPI00145DF91E|nr:GNAT family N-acetyltransferase [Cytobacillus spongiae]MCA1062633.1 GNAT family N-acetyltransferase [Rossellomorea aquimaris]NMH69977.1 GNAT family N-acetyltransferase [Bacillus sp. RO3]UII58689.1 GNAT family N-acetyltransferase [Cytobacillus spongiae]WJV31609.1 GNAT family N-acetyltransferase [Rossellomorea sp. AcN35-11]
MNLAFTKIIEPDTIAVNAMNRWDNDPELIPFIRPNRDRKDLEHRSNITLNELSKRLDTHHIYLIYLDQHLIGEMNYMVDPGHLYKKERGTAWVGITIGEREGRGKGIGFKAIQYLEKEIKRQGLNRIELGVFEFNTQAYKLYQKLGYQEIARISSFTFWDNRMWEDIRMEKYVGERI